MKNYLIIISLLIFSQTSCLKSDPGTDDGGSNQNQIGSETFFTIGDNFIYDYSDIGLYDSSTHIIYFKEIHPEFDKIRQLSFVCYDEGDSIYQGEFWPSYLSSLPSGSYVSNSPFFYQNYALRIDYLESTNPDLRNDPRIIKSLKDRELLHSGLTGTIQAIEIGSSIARLTFVVTNMDKSALLILDPDKMGHKLFHYFTNGLYLRNLATNNIIASKLEYQAPVPSNGWKKEWLTELSPGESASFVFVYSFDKVIGPGNYRAWFDYPGLSSQVDIDEVFQASGRIWLGDITAAKNIAIP
jgi:hypothetical protein